ncbi:pheromone A receptor-domain-containing protein [Daedaleopsis nitida]|nr:pheromone A receptor-domain-containing protein [Daedaleopsis nitida]
MLLFQAEFDPTYPLFPIFSFFGVVLGLLPISWHLQAWNAGTCIYMLWAALASLVEFVDSIVWYGSLRDVAPVWCDISTKFLIGAGVGIPASSLCIARRLYKITSVSTVSITRKEKLKNVYIDTAIAFGVPVIVMALHYIVQGHRYNIIENIGCTPDIWNTVPAYPLVFIWPVVLGFITFVYAALTLRTFYIHRVRFNHVITSNSSLTVSRYLRLIILCCMEMALVTPLTAFSIYINTAGLQVQPWVSWANTHYNFSFVELFPTPIWQAKIESHIAIEMGRWVYPCSAIMFFMLFGFADEARRSYSAAYWRVAKVFGFLPKSQAMKSDKAAGFKTFRMPESPSSDILPPYAPPAHSRYGRADSFVSSIDNVDLEKGFHPLSTYVLPPIPPHRDSMFGCSSDAELSPRPTEVEHDARLTRRDTQYTESQSDSDSVSIVHISISDEHPASTPPTPVPDQRPVRALSPGSHLVPAYHRPFSPPLTWPAAAATIPRKASAGEISIMVHTESHTF